jgi:hypothetical protein
MPRTIQGDFMQEPAIASALELQEGSPLSRPFIDGG